ncbi:hypothetical protein QTN25_002368 [Entamoeba marina]
MSKGLKQVNEDVLRNRKRVSRNSESAVVNTILYIMIEQLGATVTLRRTKKTKQTVKMMLPESLIINNVVYDQNAIAELNKQLYKEVLEEESKDVEGMSDKQYIRTREAQVSNGLLYILISNGYSIDVKKTKRSKLTEKLIKINALTLPNGNVIDVNHLVEIGEDFCDGVLSLFGRDQTVKINAQSCSSLNLPELPSYNGCSFNQSQDSNSLTVDSYSPCTVPDDQNICQQPYNEFYGYQNSYNNQQPLYYSYQQPLSYVESVYNPFYQNSGLNY